MHPEVPESMSDKAKTFILRCFQADPAERATATALLQEPFLTGARRARSRPLPLAGGQSRGGDTGWGGPGMSCSIAISISIISLAGDPPNFGQQDGDAEGTDGTRGCSSARQDAPVRGTAGSPLLPCHPGEAASSSSYLG